MHDLISAAGSYTDGDIDTNRSANPTLQTMVEARYSRRQALVGGMSTAAVAFLGGAALSACRRGKLEQSPTVATGAAQSTSSGKAVQLTGTATDDGTVASTVWTQTSGPAVTISGATTPTASFIAPSVATSTALGFRLTATDDKGAVTTADTIVTVAPATLDFAAVPKGFADQVVVPAGYTATVLYRTGDPIDAATPAWKNDGTDTGMSHRAGDHHDGMSYFGLATSGAAPDPTNSSRGLLALNHENINQKYLHPNGPSPNPRPEAEALKEMESHGVSVVEINRSAGWSYIQTSSFNRRITPLTPMSFSGPVRGNASLHTVFSADGTKGRGTVNNCANGYMPWGTYLTDEENWAGYFRRDVGDNATRGGPTAKEVIALTRYGVREGAAGNFGWSTVTPADPANTAFARWNATANPATAADGTADFRNEPNQFGWVVEIDPFDPASTPRKRTALGRMNHEGCTAGAAVVGRKPAFYMGDDAANEYCYKFISATPWVAADAASSDRLAIGDKYLDFGTLYVAKFNVDGSGTWMPLVFGTGPLTSANAAYPFADQADVLIHARLAADALGATKMDRPEWTAVNPKTGEMYLTLTQNTTRTSANTNDANPRAYVDPKIGGGQTSGNANGHIIRLREADETTEASSFTWDIYVFGAGSDLDPDNINISGLDASNDFSMCDGLWFARASNPSGLVSPVMWIETDDNAYTDVTNCMLLAAMPGAVGDGGTKTITNSVGGAGTQATRVGAAPGARLRRFLVGPKECEITGLDSTPDGRALFVNIQHPGENGSTINITSHWPSSESDPAATDRPRSATIVVTKDDGGVVGL